MKNMSRSLFILFMVVLLVLVSACGTSSPASTGGSGGGAKATDAGKDSKKGKVTLTIGTASTGSVFYVLGVGIADIISKNTNISASAVAAGGSDAILRAMADNKADLGLTSGYSLQRAYDGAKPFEKKIDLRKVVHGQETGTYLIARADRGIKSPADLKGKKVIGKRPALGSVDEFTYAILDLYGVDPKDVNIISTAESNESVQALQQGTVDAIVLPGGIGSPHIKELAQTADVNFVKIDKLEQLLTHKGITKGTYIAVNPPGTFKGQDGELPFLAYNTILVANPTTPADVVYEVTKTIMDKNADLKKVHPTGAKWTLKNTLNNAEFTVPFHDGAIKYFKEKGAWNDKMQARQDQLLKK
jgi:TRAP transporter TAXI family solute receptor